MRRIILITYPLFSASSLSTYGQEMPDMSKMGNYTFVMLVAGPDRNQDSLTLNKIQTAHLQHIMQMKNEGVLDIAGPFLDDGAWRGILIFNITDLDRIKELIEADPAVQSKRLSYIIHPFMAQKGSCLKQ